MPGQGYFLSQEIRGCRLEIGGVICSSEIYAQALPYR